MSEETPTIKRPHFSSVKRAREAIRERMEELVESYMALASEARAAKDFEIAEIIYWKLIDHAPKDDEGNRVIDTSTSKPSQGKDQGQIGPSIQIGIQLGGIGTHKELPPIEVIDITPSNDTKK